MKKRIVSTCVWTDSLVLERFSPEDKLFWVYVLTNPNTTQLGIYPFSVTTAASQLGYSKETVKILLDRFENQYGVLRYSESTSEIAVKNYLRHSIVSGGKPVMDLLLKEELSVKDKTLVGYVFENLGQYDPSTLNKTVIEFIDAVQSGVTGDSQNANVKKTDAIPYAEIIGHLNEKTGSRYSAQSVSTKKHINARYKEGRTYEDFIKVIDAKVAEWGDNPKMRKYLRPETLFNNKFEWYLMNAEQGGSERKEVAKSRFDVLDRDFYDSLVSKGAIIGDRLRIMRLTGEESEKLRSYGLL